MDLSSLSCLLAQDTPLQVRNTCRSEYHQFSKTSSPQFFSFSLSAMEASVLKTSGIDTISDFLHVSSAIYQPDLYLAEARTEHKWGWSKRTLRSSTLKSKSLRCQFCFIWKIFWVWSSRLFKRMLLRKPHLRLTVHYMKLSKNQT